MRGVKVKDFNVWNVLRCWECFVEILSVEGCLVDVIFFLFCVIAYILSRSSKLFYIILSKYFYFESRSCTAFTL